MLATAPGALEQLAVIACAAAARAPVFVAGESGTGKELAARAIHEAGARRGQPFVALNCAALPETLAESELFGVERGAYTGATRTRAGAFAQAHGGTLFLDEVGELPPLVQAKLLRALEAGEVQPVGSGRTIAVDVRVVAASWRDLEDEADRGQFRHDLLHRLCVLRVDLLPLRERKEDVLPLLHDMLVRHEALDLAPDPVLARRLTDAPWRGNVRELRNCVQRAVAAREPMSLMPRERPECVPQLGSRQRNEQARELLASALKHYRGNRKHAARALGVSRSTIYRWMGALEVGEVTTARS
jgi:DNA-binding NtrC family response regulator